MYYTQNELIVDYAPVYPYTHNTAKIYGFNTVVVCKYYHRPSICKFEAQALTVWVFYMYNCTIQSTTNHIVQLRCTALHGQCHFFFFYLFLYSLMLVATWLPQFLFSPMLVTFHLLNTANEHRPVSADFFFFFFFLNFCIH